MWIMSDITIETDVKKDDFYTQLIEFLNDGKTNEALELFETLESEIEQLRILYQITLDFGIELDGARDLAHIRTRKLDLDLALVYDLARNLAGNLVLAYNLALTHGLDGNSDLEHALHLARVHAHVLDLNLNLDPNPSFKRVRSQVTFILAVPIMQIEVGSDLSGEIILDGIDILTPHILTTQVAPYLEALADIQKVISDLKNESIPEFKLSHISQNSPLSISLQGVSDTIETLLNIIIPWRREHGKEIKRLEREKTAAEVLDIRAAAQEKRANAAEKRAVVDQKEVEMERLRLENEILRDEIDGRKIRRHKEALELMDLALRIVDTHAPNLQEAERLEYAQRLLAPIYDIVTSELEPRTGQDKAS